MRVLLVVALVASLAGCMAVQSMAGRKVFGLQQLDNPPGETACNLQPGTNRYTTTVHLRYYIKATAKGGHVIDDTGRLRATEHRAKVEVPEEVLAEARSAGAKQLAPCTGRSAESIEQGAEVVGHRVENVRQTNTVKTKYGSETDPNMLFYEIELAATVSYDAGGTP